MASVQTIDIEEISQRAGSVSDELRAGRCLELTRDGLRIAEIVPCSPDFTDAEREAAWQELKAMLEQGFNLGGWTCKNRDELYERD